VTVPPESPGFRISDADRERAAQLLGDVDGTLTRAQARVDSAQKSFDEYVTARVNGPLP
jgi:hypothetical protein